MTQMTFRNRVVDKGQLKKLIAWAFTKYGSARTANMADKLKDLGFRYATKAGVSISVDDLQVPPSKKRLLEAAEAQIRMTENRYTRGEITEVERFQKVIDTWNSTSEALKDEVVRYFRATDPLNSVYMMAFSGARGNISQVRQLVGMRGLMADPQGEIIDLPIKTNFREGLTVTEYIISSYGARKGLVDTALRTADSGYLTRRLVDVSQDVIVRDPDCGTTAGIHLGNMKDGDRISIPLKDRLLGRVLARPVLSPQTGETIARRNDDIDADLAKKIVEAGVETVIVRSPLTCEASRSVCQKCYGWSLAHAHMVDLGEAVGIIAAQSIGEPGTQLTMRTFHTGGVFSGAAREVLAPCDGTVSYKNMRTREVTRANGEEILVVDSPDAQLVLEVAPGANIKPEGLYSKTSPIEAGDIQVSRYRGSAQNHTMKVPAGSTLLVANGSQIHAGQVLAQVPTSGRNLQRSTEKATKDVATDLAGEVCFADIVPEERRDRQGNTTRIAKIGGLIWVLSGKVYNMPPGAEPVVKNGDRVQPGSVLAQTNTRSEHGGIVRLPSTPPAPPPSPSQTEGAGKTPREIEVVTASVLLDQARVILHASQGKEQYAIVTATNEQFLLKATPGSKVLNNQAIAELLDDSYRTKTGGIIKYAGVEVKRGKSKQGYEVVKGGTLLWIPEECHEVNKDISLLLVEDGQYVEAGTEVVKDIFCASSGVVEVTQKNDILREIVIKPGEIYLQDGELKSPVKDGALIFPGQEIIPGLSNSTEQLRYLEVVDTPGGTAILLRPVTEFAVPDIPKVPSQESSQDNRDGIKLRAVQRLPYKDGERVKSVHGLELLRTQLVLEIEKNFRSLGSASAQSGASDPNILADLEVVPDESHPEIMRLQLVILENLVIRREFIGTDHNTRILVSDGEAIAPGAIVARTEIIAKEIGFVRGIREGTEAIRRILIVRQADQITLQLPPPIEGEAGGVPKLTVKEGDFLLAGSQLNSGVEIPESGQVVKVERLGEQGTDLTITLRMARPYRVSAGAILHINDGDLVQRGDNLVLLVFERSKTGDIIQGLPRIEELLEARKPKESCVLATRPGVAQVVDREDESVEVTVVEDDGTVSEYSLGPGQNPIASDGERVNAATPLSDGPANPHQILEVFFNYYQESGVPPLPPTDQPFTSQHNPAYQLLPPVMGLDEAALAAFEQVQTFLVNEVQSVYQSQGIDISDKHIEVIVRQMTSKVRIDDGGDTTMLPGELVELYQVQQVNEAMAITGRAPASYTPVLLGITKASLNTDSFISAASFQETTRVLTEAAIEGKSDWLRGLKENVIIGRLIPAGTGFNSYGDLMSSPEDLSEDTYGLDEELDLKDVVLDDQTARSYGAPGSRGDWSFGAEVGVFDQDLGYDRPRSDSFDDGELLETQKSTTRDPSEASLRDNATQPRRQERYREHLDHLDNKRDTASVSEDDLSEDDLEFGDFDLNDPATSESFLDEMSHLAEELMDDELLDEDY